MKRQNLLYHLCAVLLLSTVFLLPGQPASAQTWVQKYNSAFSGNVSAGGAGSTLIDGGGWTDVAGSVASVVSSKLQIAASTNGYKLSKWFVRNDAATKTRDQRILLRVAPGDFSTTNCRKFLMLRQAASNTFLMIQIDTTGACSCYVTNQNDVRVSAAQLLGPVTIASAGTINNSDYYDIEVIVKGAFPTTVTYNLYDQTASPPTFGTGLSSPAITGSLSSSSMQWWEECQGPANFGLTSNNASVNLLYTNVAIYSNSDLQPAQPSIVSNTSAGVSLQAYTYADGKTTYGGKGPVANGGDGSSTYTYYWHRSTTQNFSPGAGTRISGALTGNAAYTDSTISAGTNYYYALETTDGTTTAYTYLGYVSTASLPVLTYPSSGSEIRMLAVGHSYIAGNGASTAGVTDLVDVATSLLSANTLGYGARTLVTMNMGQAGSVMFEWDNSHSFQRYATQRGLMNAVDRAVWMLSTNDAANSNWTSGNIPGFWTAVTANLAGNIPSLKYQMIMPAPPVLASSKISFTQAKTFATAQLGAANGKTIFIIGADIPNVWNTVNTSTAIGYNSTGTTFVQCNYLGNVLGSADATYGGKAPAGGPFLYSDQLHPNDWGHWYLGNVLAAGILESENTYNNTRAVSVTSGANRRSRN